MSKQSVREELILQELARHGRVAVDELGQKLQVNTSTIRRDLERLEEQRMLRRVHGGAVPIDALSYTAFGQDLSFHENMTRQVEEKTEIALAAARLIEPGDTIALSPGTTTTYLARTIRHQQIPNLTVVTSAINIAMELAGMRSLDLVVTGGILLSDFFAMVGPIAEQSLGQMYVNKAFVGITGISPEHGLTGPNQLEALTHRATLQRAQQAIVLADQTKLGRVALYHVAPITAVHTLITSRAAPAALLAELEALSIKILVV